jgi:hypothetical protein
MIPSFAVLSLVLTACAPPVPDSGAGYDARREAILTGIPGPNPVPLPAPEVDPLPPVIPPDPATEAAEIAAETRAALGAPPAVGPLQVGTAQPDPAPFDANDLDLDRNNPAISREQDFEAVSAERDIEADAERLRAARAQYRLVTPTPLERPAENGPNIIAYALERAQPRGASGTFPRSPLASARRSETRCAGYRTPDTAQEAFLEAGGPDRDRLNLDPDGDGNACAWDPATYASLVGR